MTCGVEHAFSDSGFNGIWPCVSRIKPPQDGGDVPQAPLLGCVNRISEGFDRQLKSIARTRKQPVTAKMKSIEQRGERHLCLPH
jgi:hypothetical protein